jgi:hypothetical protein
VPDLTSRQQLVLYETWPANEYQTARSVPSLVGWRVPYLAPQTQHHPAFWPPSSDLRVLEPVLLTPNQVVGHSPGGVVERYTMLPVGYGIDGLHVYHLARTVSGAFRMATEHRLRFSPLDPLTSATRRSRESILGSARGRFPEWRHRPARPIV